MWRRLERANELVELVDAKTSFLIGKASQQASWQAKEQYMVKQVRTWRYGLCAMFLSQLVDNLSFTDFLTMLSGAIQIPSDRVFSH